MTTLPYTSTGTGAGNYHADADGYIQVFMWAGGGGGSGGVGLSHGGSGGGGGALSVFTIHVSAGGDYPFFVGDGGAGGAYNDGPGSNGQDSYWGPSLATASYKAQGGRGAGAGLAAGGAGGGTSGSVGDSIEPGGNGTGAINANYSGQPGGKGGGTAGGAGGTATGGGGQQAGGPGSTPGGGGSGGGQSTAGVGGAGAPGRVYIITATDVKVGYHVLGVDSFGVYQGAGQYDWTAEADGVISCELWGSGAGGAGGVSSALQGRSGGGGGAYVRKYPAVYKGVVYRRTVPAGGAGSNYVLAGAPAAPGAGADATFTLAPISVATKQISGNVAILTFATPHGYSVGDSIIVAGVDTTFNGTFTVTVVGSDRKSLRYAKTASNVGPSAATGTVSPNFNIALAKGGSAPATSGGVGTGGAGGSATSSLGDVKFKGEDGEDCWGTQAGGVVGTNGGYGGYPNGGIGGWGGKRNEDDNTVVAGAAGAAPGGGGGGGAGQTNGNGGAGAPGGAVLRYILSLGNIVQNGVKKPILRIRVKDNSGVVHDVTDTWVVRSGAKVSQKKVIEDPDAGIRAKPSYIPAGSEGLFDVNTGRFNWVIGAPHVGPALAAKNFHWVHVGDSVSDGSTGLNRTNPLDYTINYPTAYPRLSRTLLASLLGTTEQGTGLVRPANVATADPQWARGSWSDKTHYLESSSASAVATFTPVVAGTDIRVVTIGTGSVTVTIDNVLMGTIAGGATDASVQAANYHLAGAAAIHVVKVSPAVANVTSRLLGADSYTPGDGIKVHNLSQGGSRAALGSASSPQQNVWGDTGAAAPTNMTNIYKDVTCYERRPDAVVLALGGNDAFQLISASNIKTAMDTIGQAFDHANTDIIIYPDTHNTLQIAALMDLCVLRGWAMIDFFWLSRNLRSIFGLDYNGDTYGHLNQTTGAQWMRDLFVKGVRGSLT